MKDSRIEQFLKSNGVKYSYVEAIPLSRIVVDASAKEQIRLEPKHYNEETILRYAEAYRQGDRFPALVLFGIAGERYAVINGLHRSETYRRLEVQTTDAYVVDVGIPKDVAVISRLRRSVNVIEGRAPSAEEAIQQALQLVREGMTATDAAKVLRLKPQRVYKQLNYEKSFATISEQSGLKPSEVDSLGRSAIEDLGKVTHPKVVGEMTRFAYEASLNGTEIEEFSRQVRAAVTDTAKEAVVLRWREDHKDRLKWPHLTPPVSRLRNLKLYGQKVTRELQSDALKQMQKKDRIEAIRFLKRLVIQIQAMIRRLESNGTTSVSRSSHVSPRAH